MKTGIQNYLRFLRRCIGVAFVGDWRYYAWMGALTLLTLVGLNAYAEEFVHGGGTGLTDQVSWGVFIANYTFLVGIAAAAVMLVIPVYIYHREELHELVIFGELLAVAAIIMVFAFVMADLGRPMQAWHMLPVLGKYNFPSSLFAWNLIVLGGYFLLNLHICGYLLYCRYSNTEPKKWFSIPFVFIGIVFGISIHTVTGFIFEGLGGKPFWNTALLAPRFIASAFVSGPAMIILAFQVIRRFTNYSVSNKALLILRQIVQISLIINMFFLGSEVFREFYTGALHNASAQYLFFGLHGHNALVPWIWTGIGLNLGAMVLLMLPVSQSIKWLDVACVMAIVGVWIEKGMGLVVPGFIPTPLGEIVEYVPSTSETLISIGIWAFGLLCYTIFLRMSVPILEGQLNKANESEVRQEAGETTGLSGASVTGSQV